MARGRRPTSSCVSSSTRAAVTMRSFVTAEASLRDFSQGLLQRTFEARVTANRLQGRVDRLLGKGPMIPQVHERGEQIVAHAGSRGRGVAGRLRDAGARQPILQLEHDALGRFLTDAGN